MSSAELHFLRLMSSSQIGLLNQVAGHSNWVVLRIQRVCVRLGLVDIVMSDSLVGFLYDRVK